ncbi:MAG: 5'-nucleotidase C-terminal domain-containing protein [Fusobacteriaceae bacterium]
MKKCFNKILIFVFLLSISTILLGEKTLKLQLLQTSDMHGKFMPYEYSTASEDKKGSTAQIATIVKQLRKENPYTLLIDTGDTIQDNSHELFLKKEVSPIILAMNEIKYDAFIPGNHEFNFGMETLDHIRKSFKGDFLLANLYKGEKRVFIPYKIYEKKGVKIAIIGVVTPHIMKWDSENLYGYTATNPVEEVKKLIPEIKKNSDIIIVAAHMPVDHEYGNGDSAREIAEANPDVLVVFAGHEHALKNERAKTGAVLIEPGKWSEYIAKIDVTLTLVDKKWIVLDRDKDVVAKNLPLKDIEPDKELIKKLTPFHEEAIADSMTVIGKLTGGNFVKKDEIEGIPTTQTEPTPMISFINEVQAYYTKADISSAAAFRSDANMYEGLIKKSDVSLIYKYDNTLRAYRLTGAQLKKYMEWSVSFYNQFKDGDLTISFNENIRGYNYDMFSGVTYDINISKVQGQRIENLKKLDGTPVNDSDSFVVAVNDYRGKTTFLAENGGLFKPNEIELVVDLAETMGDNGRVRELIKEYIQTVKGGIITPKISNNWKITGYKWDSKFRDKVAQLVSKGKITIPKSSDLRTNNVKSITVEDVKNVK